MQLAVDRHLHVYIYICVFNYIVYYIIYIQYIYIIHIFSLQDKDKREYFLKINQARAGAVVIGV